METVTIAGRTAPAVDCADSPLVEVEEVPEPTLRRLAVTAPKP